ncbi:MAG: response regulator [Nitrospirales bacterium]
MNSELSVLLVEDDQLDVKAVKRAFTETKVMNPLVCRANGQEALDYLRNKEPTTDAKPAPAVGLILLDLDMPIMGGIEFIREYRADKTICHAPVVVLTTSRQEEEKLETYRLGIAGYIVKPVEFTKFTEAIKRVDLYWSLCELPTT